MPPRKLKPSTSRPDGWHWTSPPVAFDATLTFYESASKYINGRATISVSVGDFVLTQVDPDEPSTKLNKLCFWGGQIGSLYEEKIPVADSDRFRMNIRFFESPIAYARQTKSKVPFLNYEMIETDMCERNPLEIVVKKVQWLDAPLESQPSEDENGLPDLMFSRYILIKCGKDGKLRSGVSDQLWPAPPETRLERLRSSCLDFAAHYSMKESVKSGLVRPASRTSTASDTPVSTCLLSPIKSDDPYARAAYHLQLSIVPELMPCRESERAQVEGFLDSAMKSEGGSGNIFYISGMPGTGKTATVLGVIKRRQEISEFSFFHINALKLNTPADIYTELCQQMSLRRGVGQAAVDRLDSYFSSPSKTRFVLLLDEIDYLVTKSQTVCYKLFDWPTLPHSKLAIIAISNTMDLPERLIPRVASRLGLCRLNFLPYNRDQIKEVLLSRLTDAQALHIFDESAIQLCAMRVAATSGDVRKALQTLRRAVELRKGEKVTSMDANNAQQDLSSNLFITAIGNASLLSKRALLSLYLELNRGSVEATTLRKVWQRFDRLVNQQHVPEHHFRRKTYKDFFGIIRLLESSALVVTKPLTRQVVAEFQIDAGNIALTKDGNKQPKAAMIDPENDDDEDGALLTISFNGMLDVDDVRHALVEEANDPIAKRYI